MGPLGPFWVVVDRVSENESNEILMVQPVFFDRPAGHMEEGAEAMGDFGERESCGGLLLSTSITGDV